MPDPIVFARDLRVTIQQVGYAIFGAGDEAAFERYAASHPAAGAGWETESRSAGRGIAERVDDYCATAFVYCAEPQAVPRVDLGAAVADIERRQYERASAFERMLGGG